MKEFFRSNPQLKRAVIAALVTEFLLLLLILPWKTEKDHGVDRTRGILKFDDNINLALFVGIPLFVLTLVQLYHTEITNRSGLVKEFAAKLHTELMLSEAFFYLIYNYDNDAYDAFVKADPSKQAQMQNGRTEGRRMYDPDKFQGTEEERRLDAFFGYLDVMAFHYHRGVLPMKDIVGSMGFHLIAIYSRKASVAYRSKIPKLWKDPNLTLKGEDFISVAPFRYLEILLEDFRNHCIANKLDIDRLNAKVQKTIKGNI